MTADLTPWPTFVAEEVAAMEERRRVVRAAFNEAASTPADRRDDQEQP